MSSQFSGAASALGYIYQIRYALYLFLQERDEEVGVSIERLDDVAFEQDGTPKELLQLKHHINRTASLTDSCPELWKTIRVWSTEGDLDRIRSSELILTLITTGQARDNSVASMLKPFPNKRDPEAALQKLIEVANNSDNESLKGSFQAFLTLDHSDQAALIKSINILDASPTIAELPAKIMRLLLTIRPEHRQGAYEQLEGWWFNKAIYLLIDNSVNNILSREEIVYKLADIADQYGPDALPIDFRDKSPEIPEDADTRMFVEQLRQIGISSRRIEIAIYDYYRAFQQRSRWARLDLLIDNEIDNYENRLIEEWEILSLTCIEELESNADDEAHKQCGRKILNHIYTNLEIPIRKKVTDPYLMRGSYHMLADNLNRPAPRVWWHPKFVDRLQQLLALQEG